MQILSIDRMNRYSDKKDWTELEIIKQLNAGDRQAFGKIYHAYHKQLYFIALRYLKDPDLSADILQEVFLKLWIKRETIDPSQDVKGFLYITLKNKVLNAIRYNKSVILKHIEISSRLQCSGDDLENRMFSRWYEENFTMAVADLPRKRRVIFKLKTFKGLDNQAVAKKLNISVNTVKVQYQIATKQVRKKLKDL